MQNRVRSTFRRSLVLLVVVGTAVGVWQGVAGASTTAGRNTIWMNRNQCATDSHTSSIGEVRLTRIGGKRIYARVTLINAEPSTDYSIYLDFKEMKSGDCDGDLLGTITTDATGRGKGTFTSGPSQHKFYFINAFNTDCYCPNETDLMVL